MVHSSELFNFINFADDTTLMTNLNNEVMRNESLHYELANVHNYLYNNTGLYASWSLPSGVLRS